MSETRHIKLPQGGDLVLKVQPGFYDKVRQHFGMFPGEPVDDASIRMFLFGAVKGAIDKAEMRLRDGH